MRCPRAAALLLPAVFMIACRSEVLGPGASPPAAAGADSTRALAFVVQPAEGVAGRQLSPAVQVALTDSLGNTVTTAADTVSLALAGQPAEAALVGTTTVAAVNGVATFTDLRLDRPGTFTLTATARGVGSDTSAPFQARVRFTTVAGGAAHTCGLTFEGAAFCWGSNFAGQLGDGTETDRLTPAPVAGGLRFSAITLGINYTCGITIEFVAWCWGTNFEGQLGDGTGVTRLTPSLVAGNHRFVAIEAGAAHTCALSTNGAAYCWGYNWDGQLGDGRIRSASVQPVAVAGDLRFSGIAAGAAHSCAVTPQRAVFCWGSNYYGGLGDGTTEDHPTPAPITGVPDFSLVVAGTSYTCGLTTGGMAYCWGRNDLGQLGDGTTEHRSVPQPVSGGHPFRALDAGGVHTCALTTADAAFCWGQNVNGQLGDGTTTARTEPVAVTGDLVLSGVTAGSPDATHSCAVTAAGGAFCWGNNYSGQLGDGSTTPSITPVVVQQGGATTPSS